MTHHKLNLPEKPCTHCGQTMVWRKAWGKNWDNVLYCSNACQRVANRLRRQAKEPVGVPPEVKVNDHGVRIWTKAKPKPVKKG